MCSKKIILCLLIGYCFSSQLIAQKNTVNWLSFEQLQDSLALKPKKVFIHFYADWCGLCKKMERKTFTDSTVVKILSTNYYAVKMNIETTKKITFSGKTYQNKNYKKRNAIHKIPLLMASRKNKPFSLPASILLDSSFTATARYFQYLNAKQILKVLE